MSGTSDVYEQLSNKKQGFSLLLFCALFQFFAFQDKWLLIHCLFSWYDYRHAFVACVFKLHIIYLYCSNKLMSIGF